MEGGGPLIPQLDQLLVRVEQLCPRRGLLLLLRLVDSIRGKVMLIQGGLDPTVLPKNSTTFVKRCIDRKIPVDFFVYPDHEHNVRGAERDHLFEKLYEYYKQNL